MSVIKANLVEAIRDSARTCGWSYATNRQLANLIGLETKSADGKFSSVKRNLGKLKAEGVVEERFDEFTGERRLKVRETEPPE